MTPDAQHRMQVYQEGQRAAGSGAICPYTDWRAKTWEKGRIAAREYYERCLAEASEPFPPPASDPVPVEGEREVIDAMKTLTGPVRLLAEIVNLCAIGDVDETTEAYGWGEVIKEAKAYIAAEQPEAPTAAPLEPSGSTYGIIDPDYGRAYTIARKLAWEEGYAIGLHGSFTRDLDLVAVPWVEKPCEPFHLVRRIVAATGLKLRSETPGAKPQGRLVWTLLFPSFGDPRFVDFSVIPPARSGADQAAALNEIASMCESHPLYLGEDATDEDINREGGDAAFVTYMAHLAREALSGAGSEEGQPDRAEES